MLEATLQVTMHLAGPVLSRSSVPGEPGIDTPFCRRHNGELYLPGSLVRGRLRAAWNELEGVDPGFIDQKTIGQLLGDESGDGNRPDRAWLRFSDFLASTQPKTVASRVRIQIDAESGSAVAGALQVVEAPFESGEEVCFTGTIRFIASRDAIEDVAHRVRRGLQWTPNFGGLAGIGFGQVQRVEVEVSNTRSLETDAALPASVSSADTLALLLTFREPICVAKPGPTENLFESEESIAGGVLKGALATELNAWLGRDYSAAIDKSVADPAWKSFATAFEQIRITHAFPAESASTQRPVVPPLSLIKDADETAWYDAAHLDGPALLQDQSGAWRAPAFAVDWKGHGDVRAGFGWPEQLPRELRVRTAIDPDRRRALDGQLFAYEMIVPDNAQWVCRVDLSGVAASQRDEIRQRLCDLLGVDAEGIGHLDWIGKTKARAAVRILPATDVPDAMAAAEPGDGLVVLTLQTPALLCPPEALQADPGRSAADAMQAALRAVWKKLSGDALELVRHFSSQSVRGGHLWHRFQRGRSAGVYEPFLLTDAGSVFVLRRTGDAADLIDEWCRRGLPLPAWACEAHGESWEHNPYVRENGYGEIAVNLACHTTLPPAERTRILG